MLKEGETYETKGNPELELMGVERAEAVLVDVRVEDRKTDTGEFKKLVLDWELAGLKKRTELSWRGSFVEKGETGLLLQQFRDLLDNQKITLNDAVGGVYRVEMRNITSHSKSVKKIYPVKLLRAPARLDVKEEALGQ